MRATASMLLGTQYPEQFDWHKMSETPPLRVYQSL